MKSNHFSILVVDSGSSNNRTAKITSEIFCDSLGVTFIRFGINIETKFMLGIGFRYYRFKRRAKYAVHFVKKSSAEGRAKKGVVKVRDAAPEAIVTQTAFRNETMDMRIPFKVSAESMEDHNKTRGKIFGFIEFKKHARNNRFDRMEKAIKKRTIFKEERAKVLVNGKDTMAVRGMNELKRHTGSTFNGIFIATSRTEATVTAKGNKFKLTAMRTAKHGPTEGRIAAVNHFVHVINNRRARMQCINDFFIMVDKDFL